jgi:LmbE family N-acetylglucosaminyl deacetylase
MIDAERVQRAATRLVLAGLILAGASSLRLPAQQAAAGFELPVREASEIALPLAEDRGAAALEQSLKRLSTTASVMEIVAHPDDEDGALLTWLSRGLGARVTLLTLTRGEGGQNAISADSYDALGLIRTNELLKADEFYGIKQLWGTEVDFGFSKTQEESFARWGHDRVLYDAVLAVRQERPQIILSTFVGGVSDGHGHHQVSGEIAQEVFKAAGDPKVFPEQLQPGKDGQPGLQPWQPLAVYSMTPFAPITDNKIFDYATGKSAPARFKNYVTGEWIEGAISTDVTLQVGTRDPVLGRSYAQIAREGWGEQKSQNGGANPALSGPASSSYHLWAVAPEASAKPETISSSDDLFHNGKVQIDTGIAGLTGLTKGKVPQWLVDGLREIDTGLNKLEMEGQCQGGTAVAHKLAPIYRQTLALRARIEASDLDVPSKSSLLFELDAKIDEFQDALKELLGLDMMAFRARTGNAPPGGPGGRGGSADEMPPSVTPGEEFRGQVHTAQATQETKLTRVWLESSSGDAWKSERLNEKPGDGPDQSIRENAAGTANRGAVSEDAIFSIHAPANAEPTEPYFTRPSIEQSYYDLTRPEDRLRSFAPYPLAGWAEFSFDGLPIRVGQVVQAMQRVTGLGGVYEPLVVTPAIGVRMEPEARILPLDGSALPVRVTVHAQATAEGTITLKLPAGWFSDPAEASFHLTSAGDSEPLVFSVYPADEELGTHNLEGVVVSVSRPVGFRSYSIEAVARSAGHEYKTGWQSVGYAGLRPYNLYRPAQLKTRKVDVKLAPGLRVGYVMGTGDLVPQAIESLGVAPHLLTAAELTTGDLSAWNVIVIGIRAYSARPELTAAQPRLEAFVRQGGTLIVQYQSSTFPAPLPLSMGRMPERVVDEQAPVKLLEPANPLLLAPNAIGAADFDGWVEERGHSFLDSWDPGYTALTETADAGQEPQRGGLVVAHFGKGAYVYVAFALYRQFPELVPGAYRLMANLLSVGKEPRE